MAENDLTPLVILGGVAIYLATRPPRDGNSAAAGTPPKPNGGISTEAAVGGLLCAGGAAYLGATPQAAAAAGAVCSKLAPAVVDGFEYAGGKVVDYYQGVGKFASKLPSVKIATTIVKGGYGVVKNFVEDPTGTIANTLGIPESLQFGSSKVGRASNGKDVFPNDMRECKTRYGITDMEQCGQLYDLNTRRWPWQPAPAGAPPAPAPAAPAPAKGPTIRLPGLLGRG